MDGDALQTATLDPEVTGDAPDEPSVDPEVLGDQQQEPAEDCACCSDCELFTSSVCVSLTSECANLNDLSFTAEEVDDVACRHWSVAGDEVEVDDCTYTVNADFYCGCVDGSAPCPTTADSPNCAIVRVGGITNCGAGGEWFLVTEPGGSDRNLPVTLAGSSGTATGYVQYEEGLEDCECPCPAGTAVTVAIENGECPEVTIPVPCCDPVTQRFPGTIFVDSTGDATTPYGAVVAQTAVPMYASELAPGVYWWRSDLIDIGPHSFGGRLMVRYAAISCTAPGGAWEFQANLYQNDELHPSTFMLATFSSNSTSVMVDCDGLEAELSSDNSISNVDVDFHFYE